MRTHGDQLVLAARLDQQVGGAADLERRERRERRVDGHAARPEACLELGGARLERGRGHRVIVGHGVTDATPGRNSVASAARSPGAIAERVEQLVVDAVEAAVRHDDDEIARARLRARRCRRCRRWTSRHARAGPGARRSATSSSGDSRRSSATLLRNTGATTTSSAPSNASTKSLWNTFRHDEAERGSKIAQMRRVGCARRSAAMRLGDGGRMVREVVVDLDAVDRRRAARGGA